MAKFGTRQMATILALAALLNLNGKSEVNAGKGGANNNAKSEVNARKGWSNNNAESKLNVGKDGTNNNGENKLNFFFYDYLDFPFGPHSVFSCHNAMAEKIVEGFDKYLFKNIGEIEVIKFDKNKFQQESNFVIKRTMLSLHDKMMLYNPQFFSRRIVDIVRGRYIEVPGRKIYDNPLGWFNDKVDVYVPFECDKVREISLKSIVVDRKVDIAYEDFMKGWYASWGKLSRDISHKDFMKKWRAYWSKASDKNKLQENKAKVDIDLEEDITYKNFMEGWRAYWSKLSKDIAHKDFMKKWRASRSKLSKENKLNDISTTLEYEKEIKLNVIKFKKLEYEIRNCTLFNNAAFFVDYDGNTLSATLVKVNKDGSITVKKKTSPSTTDLEFKLK